MGEQKIDGVLAQVPGRRAIASRFAPGQAFDRRIGAHEIGFLLRPALLRGRHVRPAVMRHLVAVAHDLGAGGGMALDGKSRDEPGRAQPAGFQQRENAPGADEAKFSARQRRRRRHAARDEARLRVEIERETDDVAGQRGPPYGNGR